MMPWPGAKGEQLRGHEFHHSSLENLDPAVRFAYQVQRGHGVDGARDGIVLKNLVASYAHLRSEAGSGWAARFVAFVRAQQGLPAATPARSAAALAA